MVGDYEKKGKNLVKIDKGSGSLSTHKNYKDSKGRIKGGLKRDYKKKVEGYPSSDIGTWGTLVFPRLLEDEAKVVDHTSFQYM